MPNPAYGQANAALAMPVYITGGAAGSSTPLGYQQLTGMVAATTLTVPTGATTTTIVVNGAAVRYRDDGVAPTAAVGMPLNIGATLIYNGNLAVVQFIQQSAGAILDVTYSK